MPVIFRPFMEKLGGNTTAMAYVGTQGDLFYDPVTPQLKISDGVTPGGVSISAAPQEEDYVINTSMYVMASPPGVVSNDFIFGADGQLTVPGTIKSPYGTVITSDTGDVSIEAGPAGAVNIGHSSDTDVNIGAFGGATVRLQADRISLISDTPSTSKGSFGDIPGLIAFNSSYVYFCTGTYNGTSNIWSRVSITSAPW